MGKGLNWQRVERSRRIKQGSDQAFPVKSRPTRGTWGGPVRTWKDMSPEEQAQIRDLYERKVAEPKVRLPLTTGTLLSRRTMKG